MPHPTHLPCPTFCPALHLCPVLDFHPYTFAPPYIRTRHYTLVPPYSFIPTHLPRPTLLPHPTHLSRSTCLIRSTHLSHSTYYFLHIERQKTPGGVFFLSGFQIKRQVDSEEDPRRTEPLLLVHNPPGSSFRKHPERKPRGGGVLLINVCPAVHICPALHFCLCIFGPAWTCGAIPYECEGNRMQN